MIIQTSFAFRYKNVYKQGMFLLVVFLELVILAGCQSKASTTIYNNSLMHINLMKPENWDVAFYERDGVIVLEGQSGFLKRNSARIAIYGSPNCTHYPSLDPMEEVATDIKRIGTLYSVDPVIIKPPTRIETANRQIIQAVIGIRMSALSSDAVINQFSDRDAETIQTIDLKLILDGTGCFARAYLYKGSDQVLNEQAETIINTISFHP